MPTDLSEGVAYSAVRELLHRALTCGHPPCDTSPVGPATWAAITAVAQHHPDATVEHIVAVYDAHAVEQQRDTSASVQPMQLGDERSEHAVDYAATDTLITQLTISYPGVARDTIAGIVDELRMTLADPRLRELSMLRIEYEAHQRLAAG